MPLSSTSSPSRPLRHPHPYQSFPKHSPQLLLGIVGGPGLLSSCWNHNPEGLTHLPLWDGAGMVGSLKATAGPHPPCPTADPRNVSWDNDSPTESYCPPNCCAAACTRLFLAPLPAWSPNPNTAATENPAMDEAGDLFHTPTQELSKGKAKYKCGIYWWWSPKPYLSVQPE